MTPEPEFEAQPLDIQHDTDPAHDHGPTKRIPHLGHVLVFFSLTMMLAILCQSLVFAAAHIETAEVAKQHPGLGTVAMAAAYVLTLMISFKLFPVLWQRSFLHGIQWNVLAAHRRWFWIIPLGVAMSALAQWADVILKAPDSPDTLKIMSTQHGAYLLTAFGVLLAPMMEEIAFRGFLLPALATAYDWLSLERTPEALRRWEMTSGHSTGSVVFAAVFSTVPFALIHAPQLQHAWGPVGVIFAVGLIFAWVRVRTHSVACSTLLHATYNFSAFAWVFLHTGFFRHLERLTN